MFTKITTAAFLAASVAGASASSAQQAPSENIDAVMDLVGEGIKRCVETAAANAKLQELAWVLDTEGKGPHKSLEEIRTNRAKAIGACFDFTN